MLGRRQWSDVLMVDAGKADAGHENQKQKP